MRNFNQTKQEKRMDELEREYEFSTADPENVERLDELNFQLSGLIGKSSRPLLREYTDRLIARFNPDTDWFYQRGFNDALRLVSGKEPRRQEN